MSHKTIIPNRICSAALYLLVVALPATACSVESAPGASDEPDQTAETSSAQRPEVEFLTTPEMESMGFPFSEAVRVGDLLLLSGQVGNRPGEVQVVEGGIQAETRQTLENIRTVLERYGSSMDRVVRCLVMIDDMSEWPAMNEVYATFFPGPKPARSAVGADGLALGAKVEIECTAAVG